MYIRNIGLWLILSILGGALPGWASPAIDNSRALRDVAVKGVYFDVSQGDPDKLLFRMEMVERTVDQLTEAGQQPDVVVGFRSAASNYVTSGDHYILAEELEAKKKIQDWVARFAAAGITIEQCAIAAEKLGIDPDDFLPGVTVVKNGFVSLVGYQTKGYAVIPMD